MKRLVIPIAILLVVSLAFTNTFAAAKVEQSDKPEKSRAPKNGPTQTLKTAPDANSPAEPNAAEAEGQGQL